MGMGTLNPLVTPIVGMIVLVGWTVGGVALAATVLRRRDVV
jgi:hypothetical protein